MRCAYRSFEVLEAMAEHGNPNSISDVGVGVLAVRAAIIGAMLNVKINSAGLKDRDTADKLVAEAEELVRKANEYEAVLLEKIEKTIAGSK